ncbi:MAG: type II secretion system GspH family protein [Puniceicoccales bacterium]|jgi:prepilin-type N-terminal cleavage/methylation domain-containing protein|nr:type II secretion system GspH family protein [Puniceicoccales bacterium]
MLTARKLPQTAACRGTENTGRRAFTLIELLAVVAILGILIAVLVPTVTYSIRLTRDTAQKSTFQQWAKALDQYKSKYGYYPNLGSGYSSSTDTYYNLDEETTLENFIRAVTGKNRDGSKLSDEQCQSYNQNAFTFCTLPNDSFVKGDFENGKLTDHTGNTNIRIVLDTDGDDFVLLKDLPEDTKPLHLKDGNKLKARIFIGTLKKDDTKKDGYRDIYVTQ